LKRTASIPLLLLTLMFVGCEPDRTTLSDAELGLTAQQAHGRHVFAMACVNCHPAYSSRGNKGPGLKDLYKKPYLPSGLTATDEHVEQSILHGRSMMPAFGEKLTPQQIDDLIAYLHTL
jgi:mono/diheme cytochrome c family protein